MQIERTAKQVERVMHGLVNLLHAGARETFAVRPVAIAHFSGAQKSIRTCVLSQAGELQLHSVASLGPDARELRS